MPRSPRSRRHRSSAYRRHARWLQRTLIVVFTLAGMAVLVGVCLLSPEGRIVLGVIAAAAALFSIAVLSCLLGRLAAGVCNFFARIAGRQSLEKFLREHPPHRAA
jgi:hypothetical protein